jgi:type IV secretion system protein VirB10
VSREAAPDSSSTGESLGSGPAPAHDGFDSFTSGGSHFLGPGQDPRARGGVDDAVLGERGAAAVNRPASLQSRISNLLAAGLMGSMALGLIGWYYVHSISGHSAAGQAARATSKGKAQGEMVLPPLGKVDPPVEHFSPLASVLGSAPEIPLAPDEANPGAKPGGFTPQGTPGGARPPTPEELELTRKLSGAAFSSGAKAQASSLEEAAEAAPAESPRPTRSVGGGDLDALLRPSATPAARAEVLPTQTLLLPKGAFIDCTLETAIDSMLAGMATCITATDTFGADGKVVLLERGTKLVGETRGQVSQGSARIFVLWTEARTPTGVIVPLASPGTDELGRAGLPGEVNRHFWQRFGAAILISAINGAIQAEVQSQSNGGTVIYNPSASTDVMTEVLKSTVNIPPTVVKPQGDRIQVLVARDLDFRSVYALRVARER